MEGGATLCQQLVGMPARIERKVLRPDGTMWRHWLLELVVQLRHAHAQVLRVVRGLRLLLILAAGTDGRAGAM